MDIVLEIFDTFVLDRMYSAVLPASTTHFVSNLVRNGTTSTFSSIKEGATYTPQQFWTYSPATQYFSLQPSQYAYSSALPRDNIYRQALSLFLITWLFGLFVYFVCASLSYVFVFDKRTFNHPRYLKNQVRMEIMQASKAMPVMALLTTPAFLGEVRGYSKIYDTWADAPFPLYNYLQFPIFLLFTDYFIYWIHRGLHNPLIYKHLHKPHHKWIMPTPYASHAFHPIDGFAQSVPYHVFPYILPLSSWASLALFAFINVWTIFIHDGEYIANSPVINGAACHTLHHLYFSCNFGQYTTLWDRLGGSYRAPNPELFLEATKFGKDEWARQAKAADEIMKEVEGEDDREYLGEAETKKTL